MSTPPPVSQSSGLAGVGGFVSPALHQQQSQRHILAQDQINQSTSYDEENGTSEEGTTPAVATPSSTEGKAIPSSLISDGENNQGVGDHCLNSDGENNQGVGDRGNGKHRRLRRQSKSRRTSSPVMGYRVKVAEDTPAAGNPAQHHHQHHQQQQLRPMQPSGNYHHPQHLQNKGLPGHKQQQGFQRGTVHRSQQHGQLKLSGQQQVDQSKKGDSFKLVKNCHQRKDQRHHGRRHHESTAQDGVHSKSEIGQMMFEALTMQEWQKEEQQNIAATILAERNNHCLDDASSTTSLSTTSTTSPSLSNSSSSSFTSTSASSSTMSSSIASSSIASSSIASSSSPSRSPLPRKASTSQTPRTTNEGATAKRFSLHEQLQRQEMLRQEGTAISIEELEAQMNAIIGKSTSKNKKAKKHTKKRKSSNSLCHHRTPPSHHNRIGNNLRASLHSSQQSKANLKALEFEGDFISGSGVVVREKGQEREKEDEGDGALSDIEEADEDGEEMDEKGTDSGNYDTTCLDNSFMNGGSRIVGRGNGDEDTDDDEDEDEENGVGRRGENVTVTCMRVSDRDMKQRRETEQRRKQRSGACATWTHLLAIVGSLFIAGCVLGYVLHVFSIITIDLQFDDGDGNEHADEDENGGAETDPSSPRSASSPSLAPTHPEWAPTNMNSAPPSSGPDAFTDGWEAPTEKQKLTASATMPEATTEPTGQPTPQPSSEEPRKPAVPSPRPVVQNSSARTMMPSSGGALDRDRHSCLENQSELYDAVDEYLSDRSQSGSNNSASIKYGHPIGSWCIGEGVTDMSFLFAVERNVDAAVFDDDLSAWNTTGVTTMRGMFRGAREYRGGDSASGTWDTSSVTDMGSMFHDAAQFNDGTISGWDVSAVTNMSHMFNDARSFDQDISTWDVSSVQEMEDMFRNADAFNRDLGAWDMARVRSTRGMFRDMNTFDVNGLSNWKLWNVRTMENMFRSSPNFQSNLCGWMVYIERAQTENRTVNVDNMFTKTSCFVPGTPDIVNGANFCHLCM